MKTFVIATVLAASLATVGEAEAAGCLKGAAVGGVAGHFAGHHAILGALAGCAIGRHRAAARRRDEQRQPAPNRGDQDESGTRM